MVSSLIVAGSDSGGGAGIQADIKAMASIGIHGCTVITCVTAQNTQGVRSTYPLPLQMIEDQFTAVLEDLNIKTVKTGMLYSKEIVEVVSRHLGKISRPVVVDPVMIATVGSSLHIEGFVEAIKQKLIPISFLVTPNIHEATALSGVDIHDEGGMRKAAMRIHELGAKNVLIKGGHLKGELVDILYDGKEFQRFTGYRYPKELHGSGCTFSSLIAGFLAHGYDLMGSVERARSRIAAGFQTSYKVGKGVELINPAYSEDRYQIWREVSRAAEELKSLLPIELVPEVGINIGYATIGANTLDDVCGLSGRISRVGERVDYMGYPDFGRSKHIARIILTAMRFDPETRSATNLKYSDRALASCEAAGFKLGTFDRASEPEGVSTMEWGTEQAIRSSRGVPDIIYDKGAHGKVPMIRVLGKNPRDVISKVRRIVQGL